VHNAENSISGPLDSSKNFWGGGGHAPQNPQGARAGFVFKNPKKNIFLISSGFEILDAQKEKKAFPGPQKIKKIFGGGGGMHPRTP